MPSTGRACHARAPTPGCRAGDRPAFLPGAAPASARAVPAGARGRAGLPAQPGGGVEQLAGVGGGRAGPAHPGEHPRHLLDPVRPGDGPHVRHRAGAVVGLGDHEVVVGERGDLGQVRDDDDLAAVGQPREPAPDLHRGLAADAGVDLVEDVRADGLLGGGHDLDGEHHARQLAAGGRAGQRPGLGARVRGEQERHVVGAVRARARCGPRRRPGGPGRARAGRARWSRPRTDGGPPRPASRTAGRRGRRARPRPPPPARAAAAAGRRPPARRAGRGTGPAHAPAAGRSPWERSRGASSARRASTSARRDGVGVDAGGVPGQVGAEVGGEVRELGDPVGETGRGGVVLAHGGQRGPRGGEQALGARGSCPRRRRPPPPAPRPPPAAARRRAPGAPTPRAARRPRRRAGRPGRTRRARAAASGPPGPARGSAPRGRRAPRAAAAGSPRRPGTTASSSRCSGPAKASSRSRWCVVERSRSWSDCPWTVTSCSVTAPSTDTGTGRPPTQARARPSAGTERASSRPSSSSSPPASVARRAASAPGATRSSPSTAAAAAPARTTPGSAREPSSSPSAVTTMVLPAPVSPVRTLRPGCSGSVASAMTPRSRIRSSSITRPPPVRASR